MSVTGKICTRCEEFKLLAEYAKGKKGGHSRASRCKKCVAHIAAEWKRNNPDPDGCCPSSRWYMRNPEKMLVHSAKKRAKDLNMPFNLEYTDVVIPPICPVLGIELKPNFGGRTVSDNSPTLDRYVGGLGYVKGNVAVISNRANRIKNNATTEELRRVYEYSLSRTPKV